MGIHSGSAIAGVIGHKRFQYDLCGDAVNTAARMCSYGAPGHVHVSERTYSLLRHRYSAVCRGESEIKGKGAMRTFFLVNLPADQTEVALMHASEASGLLQMRDERDQSVLPRLFGAFATPDASAPPRPKPQGELEA